MARTEIDSFIVKFKSLLLSGRNATLELKSNAGKAQVNLYVELGDVSCPPAQHPHPRWPRDGPSRQRRRLKRAAEREAEKAEDNAEKATVPVQNRAEEANRPAKETTDEVETLKDEFCSDESFEKEKASDNDVVEKILVTADCQADWSNQVVTKLVDEKLATIGIRMQSIIVNRNIRRCFESCLVTIQPMKKQLIEKKTFPMNRWTMKCVK